MLPIKATLLQADLVFMLRESMSHSLLKSFFNSFFARLPKLIDSATNPTDLHSDREFNCSTLNGPEMTHPKLVFTATGSRFPLV